MPDVHILKSNSKSPKLKEVNLPYHALTMAISFVLSAVWLNLNQSIGEGTAISLAFAGWFISWGLFAISKRITLGYGTVGLTTSIYTGPLAVAVGIVELTAGLLFLALIYYLNS